MSTWTRLCASAALNLRVTLRSGQAFIWQQSPEGTWYGAIDDFPVELKEEDDWIFVKIPTPADQLERVQDYFQLAFDMAALYDTWKPRDKEFSELCGKFPGLRVLRQDPVECLFSFVVSQNNHVKRISSILLDIRKFAGKQISDSPEIFAFPEISDLAKISLEQYQRLGLGYRAKYFRSVAVELDRLGGRDFLSALRESEISHARETLMKFPGVGRKVADCVGLFSLDCRGLVPCDTHVLALAQKRLKKTPKKNPTPRDHDEIQKYFLDVFGEFAGWAHSVLFVARLAEFKKSI